MRGSQTWTTDTDAQTDHDVCRHVSPTCRTDAGSGPPPLNNLTSRPVVGQLSEVVPFLFAGVKVWNGLQSDVTTASSLSVFKNRLKTYLFAAATKLFDCI